MQDPPAYGPKSDLVSCILHLASCIEPLPTGTALMRLIALICGYLLSFLFFQYFVPAMSAKAIRPLSVIW